MTLSPFWPRPHPSPGLIALGAVNLLYGLFGIFGAAFALLQKWTTLSPGNPMRGVYAEGGAGGGLLALSLVAVPLNLALGAAGIAILKRRPWGRRVSLLWAVLQIPLAIVSALLTLFTVIPAMEAAMPSRGGPPEPVMRAISVISAGGGLFFSLAYPLVLLLLLNRAGFRRQFEPPYDAAPQPFPAEAWLGIPPSGRATAAAACGIAGIAADILCCCFNGYVAGIACGVLAWLYGSLEQADIAAGIAPTAGYERARLGRICGPIAASLGVLIGLAMVAYLVGVFFLTAIPGIR